VKGFSSKKNNTVVKDFADIKGHEFKIFDG